MTIRRVDETVRLEGVCAVEDSETLMQEIQAGATVIDWTECVHLHAACLQVMLVAGVPVRGMPQNPALARWVPGMLPAAMRPDRIGPHGGPRGGPRGGLHGGLHGGSGGGDDAAAAVGKLCDRETACPTEV